MDALLEKLDTKLREWGPEIAEQVRRQIAEMIDLADRDLLDLVRSRSVEQEVVDLIDEPAPGVKSGWPISVGLAKFR